MDSRTIIRVLRPEARWEIRQHLLELWQPRLREALRGATAWRVVDEPYRKGSGIAVDVVPYDDATLHAAVSTLRLVLRRVGLRYRVTALPPRRLCVILNLPLADAGAFPIPEVVLSAGEPHPVRVVTYCNRGFDAPSVEVRPNHPPLVAAIRSWFGATWGQAGVPVQRRLESDGEDPTMESTETMPEAKRKRTGAKGTSTAKPKGEVKGKKAIIASPGKPHASEPDPVGEVLEGVDTPSPPAVVLVHPEDGDIRLRLFVGELAKIRDGLQDVPEMDLASVRPLTEDGKPTDEVVALLRLEHASGVQSAIARVLLGAAIASHVDPLPEDGSKGRAWQDWADAIGVDERTVRTFATAARKIRAGTHEAALKGYLDEARKDPERGWRLLNRLLQDRQERRILTDEQRAEAAKSAAEEARKRWTERVSDLGQRLLEEAARHHPVATKVVPEVAAVAVRLAAGVGTRAQREKALRGIIARAEQAIAELDAEDGGA